MKLRFTSPLFFICIGALFFIPFLGGVHLFDWDEINFAEISREMILLNNYLQIHIDFQPFWEKPPFFFWLQAASMKIFGVGEFGARLPNAICGILSLWVLFQLGSCLHGRTFGFIWAGAYFGSILPHLYFRSGIIDPWFNLFIFLGLCGLILFQWKQENYEGVRLRRSRMYYLLPGGLILGLAILTKGPVAFLIILLCCLIYWGMKRFRMFIPPIHFTLYTIAASFFVLTWYGIETLQNGPGFIIEFTLYQIRLFSTPDAGHAGFPGYHFVVLLIGCFPASIFFLRSLKKVQHDYAYQKDFFRWMMILFWVVLTLFSIVQSKIVHYSSLCYFPLTYLASVVILHIINGRIRFSGWMRGALMAIGLLYAIAVIAAPFVGRNIEIIKPLFAKDPFGLANLDAPVHWTGWEILPGLLLLIGLTAFLVFAARSHYKKSFIALFGSTALFVLLTLTFFIKRIEGYSQRTAISFYESKVDEDCYVIPHGFKSYGHLFYTRKEQVSQPKSYDRSWLYYGDIDKDVYVIAKIHRSNALREIVGFEEISNENGFVVFRRKSQPSSTP